MRLQRFDLLVIGGLGAVRPSSHGNPFSLFRIMPGQRFALPNRTLSETSFAGETALIRSQTADYERFTPSNLRPITV